MSDDIVERAYDCRRSMLMMYGSNVAYEAADSMQACAAEITRLRAQIAGSPPVLPVRAFAEGFDIHGRPLSAAAAYVAAPPAASAPEPAKKAATKQPSPLSYEPAKKAVAPQDERAITQAILREAAANVPSSWLDPLLTGPTAVIGKLPCDGPAIERLLEGVRQRILSTWKARAVALSPDSGGK